MRILLLTHSFNGLTQRLFAELRADGHAVSVEFDIADSVTEEAVALWRPDVVIAPFLKRRIPQIVWSRVPCLIVHPGPPGDRGPAAIDWAILEGAIEWGVTVLQATGDFDAGPIWATRTFAMRPATKSSLYRREVCAAAVQAVREALAHGGGLAWVAPCSAVRPMPTMAERCIDWAGMGSDEVLRRIASADGQPGLVDQMFGVECYLFDAHLASADALACRGSAVAGDIIARRGPALLRCTADGGVWIGHVRRSDTPVGQPPLKLATTQAFAAATAKLPALEVPLERDSTEWDELHYQEFGPENARVGWLGFDFHNGAMDNKQCERLRDALRAVRARPTRVLVLLGGTEFFSNGIHLHQIESESYHSDGSAADASWRNILAINDAVFEILTLDDRLTVTALRGNAGAGGCFVALAADRIWAHANVVLNPHYKNMGNLYGSEYWTYTLPRRVGDAAAQQIMADRLPLTARAAKTAGLIDAVLADDASQFEAQVRREALALAALPELTTLIGDKQQRRAKDEATRPLAEYRAAELARIHRNFYGFDPSYHVARYHFVTRKPQAWTPRHLALHRP